VTVAIAALGGRSITQATGVMTASLPEQSLLELRKRVEAERGSVVVLQQPNGADLERWGTAPDTLPLMREVKQMFDPKRILNPGRYLGGI
jgi:glycolate oxidase FAD binding subunit